MGALVVRKAAWDNLVDDARDHLRGLGAIVRLGEPAVLRSPTGQAHYVWDDSRLGDAAEWVGAAAPGLFEVHPWGLPPGWTPDSEGPSRRSDR